MSAMGQTRSLLSCAEENGGLRASMLGWNTGIQLRGTDGVNRGTKLMRTGRARCKYRQKVRALFPNRSSSLFSELPDRGQAEVPRAREGGARAIGRRCNPALAPMLFSGAANYQGMKADAPRAGVRHYRGVTSVCGRVQLA